MWSFLPESASTTSEVSDTQNYDPQRSQLQGADSKGRQRTTMPAVYFRGFCKAIVADIKRYVNRINYNNQTTTSTTSVTNVDLAVKLLRALSIVWCLENAVMLHPCQHLQRHLRSRSHVTTSLPDLIEQFKREAMRHPALHDIKLQISYEMPAIDTLMLKLLLMKIVEESVNVIEAHKQKYRRWTEDPVYLAVAPKILKRVIDIKGICCTRRAEELPLPMPYLRTASAPWRLVFKGDIKSWITMQTAGH